MEAPGRTCQLGLEQGGLPRLAQSGALVAACAQLIRLHAQRPGPAQRVLEQRHRAAAAAAAASFPQSRLRDDEAAWAEDPARGELLRDAHKAGARGRRSTP